MAKDGSVPQLPDWPEAMRQSTAANYLDLSHPEFLREVASGRLPESFQLGSSPHWSKSQIDDAIDRMTGLSRSRLDPLRRHLQSEASQSKPKDRPPPVTDRAYSVKTLAEHWQCSDGLVRKLIAGGTLRSFKFGNLIRIAPEAVSEFEKISRVSQAKHL